jgi:hypothetical protein
MARAMGYNFLDDAVKVCNARNFGVLAYLLEGVSSFDDRRYQKIGYKLLTSLCGYDTIHDVKIVTTLFEKGLPIVDPKERYISSDDPFFKVIRSMDHYNLEELLKVVSKDQEIDMYRLKDVQKSLCWSITLRYSDQEYRSDEFNRLLKFWSNIHLEKGARLYDVEESLRKSWSLEICKGVLETAKDRGFKFRSEDCNSKILEIIKDLERSKEAERFDSLMAEVKHFPKYYSGLSSYELRDRSRPLLKKLLEAYTTLSETERVEYKGTYESAIRFLDKAIQNGKKGYY